VGEEGTSSIAGALEQNNIYILLVIYPRRASKAQLKKG
jgi:hypothetical protein